MGRMSDSTSVGANLTSANVLAGLLDEFAHRGRGQRVRLGATSSATGIRVTCLLNDVAVVNDQFLSLINRFPVIPDDVTIQERIPRGMRAFITFRNTTAGALTVFWAADTKPYA